MTTPGEFEFAAGDAFAEAVAPGPGAGEEPRLSRRIGFAVLWGSVNSVLLRLGGFVSGIIAARIIAPKDFGVFAVALTVHLIIINISSLGVTACIVREPDDPSAIAPTVATIALGSSAVLMAVMFVTAPAIAAQLGSAQAAWPIRVMSLNVLLAGIYAVPSALLAREFQQGRMLVAEVCNFGVATTVLITLGVAGAGAYALAWSYVAGTFVMTGVLMYLAPGRYRLGLDRGRAGPLLRFGLPLAGANLIAFSVYNVDYIVVGHVLGAVPLGFYLLAFGIASWPSTLFNGMVTSVALPAFSRVRDDAARLPQYVSTVVSALVALALPISALTIVVARPAVISVYGARWAAAATALAMLALFGVVRVPMELFANIIVAFGRPRALLLTQIAWFVVLVPVMVFSVERWNIKGAGIAHFLVAGAVVLPIYLVIVRQMSGVSLAALARAVTPPAFGSALAAAAGAMVVHLSGAPEIALVAGLTAGIAVYAVAVGPWFLRTLRRARDLWESADAVTSG